MKAAYAAGTRSHDGKPGPNYWENHGRYRITITAEPPNRTIHGTEQIVYRNDSPDTLKTLVIKLFMNVHKPGAPRGRGVSEKFLTSGVHIDSLAVNGKAQDWKASRRFFTWAPLRLMKPLMPHDSVHLAFKWHYTLATRPGREGAIDSTTFYMAYFYPRVAVYDDYEGWDTMSFTLGHEFYSDFNDYDVTVRVPSGYVVWGTGTLQNAAEVLQPAPLARFRKSFSSDSTIHVATKAELAAGKITKGKGMNTWHFTSHYVPDVAFGLSNHYDWDAASVLVDDATGRRAGVQAAYNDTAADFHQMVQFGRHSLDWLSHNWPGIPYPYSKTTEFQGGAGMEYPMMANDASYKNPIFARFVAEHEISHTYMPFYMGINETRYGFMDEGWATTFEYLIGVNDLGKARETRFFKKFRVNRWARSKSPLEDIPIITPGDAINGMGLGINEYGKAALGYLAMKDLLGDKMFKKCLHAYMSRWNGKHPSPWDFFYTFDNVSGRNLNWFWKNWYFSNNYIDMAIERVSKEKRGYFMTLNNIGGMVAPVDVVLHFKDGSSRTIHETPAIWKANPRQAEINITTKHALSTVHLRGGIWVDANPANNTWTAE
ncbi:MAG TPA: M1 family metallopeptidase [Balneolaceae bacterium]|nr:M1 family metallopeptidase [Balneolaceae bacterium]